MSNVKWAVNNLSFSFPSSGAFYGSSYGEGENVNDFGVLNAQQQSAVRSVLGMYASVANFSFAELTETASTHADLRFAMSNDPSTAWAYLPSTSAVAGDVWFNKSSGQYNAPTKGNYANTTITHEIGHALGLDHSHEGNAVPAARDSMEYTVMSYRSYVGASTSGGYTNESWGYAQSLMMYDIAAIQHMYGANFSSNASNTVYSWSPTTGEMFVNGVGQGAPGGNRIFQTVWDGNGNDTYDFSNYSVGLTIDLMPGAWTTTSPAQLARLHYNGSQIADGNIANALLFNGDTRSLIENVIGGSGNDRILGNLGANTLAGGNLVITWGANGAVNALVDVDGDNSFDVVQIEHSGSIGVWVSSGSTLDVREQWGTGSRPSDKIGDFNGDGRADIVQLHENGAAYVWTSTGTSFTNWSRWGWGVRPTDKVGDFSGDGRDDVIQLHENGTAYVWTSTGSSFSQYGYWGWGIRPSDQIGDFNGDGRDDVIQLHENGTAYVWTSNGGGLNAYSVWGRGIRPTDKVGDFNGDGRDDVIQLHENGTAYVWTSNDTGFNGYSVWGWGVRPSDKIGDLNGDGRDDIVQLHENGNAYVWLSNGSGFNAWTRWGSGVRPTDQLADVNGDGRDDVVRLDDSGTAFVWTSTGSGFGARTTWGKGLQSGTPSGSDTFVFQPGFGHDTISDFEAGASGSDIIEFARSLFSDFNTLLTRAQDTAAGLLITVDANNSLTLPSVVKTDIYHDDFLFV